MENQRHVFLKISDEQVINVNNIAMVERYNEFGLNTNNEKVVSNQYVKIHTTFNKMIIINKKNEKSFNHICGYFNLFTQEEINHLLFEAQLDEICKNN
jgi:hypothetical protein